MKKLTRLVIVALVLLAVCGSNNNRKVTIDAASNDTKAWEKAKELVKKDDINMEIKRFSDYNLSDKVLSGGDIDMSAFQRLAFLDQYEKTHKGTKIPVLSTTVLTPSGVYSDKIKDVRRVKDGAKATIPNDVSNQARALKPSEVAGLVKLKRDSGLAGTVKGITSDPKHLKITVVDTQQTARALSDVDIAVINNGMVTKVGKDPRNDPIFLGKSDSDAVKPYINIVAVNDKDLDSKTYAKIVELYYSKEARKVLQEDVRDREKSVNLFKDEVEAVETSLAK